jgi:hypothetical protein
MAQHTPNLTASGLSRKRGQYRVFFSDGYGLYVTIHNGQFVGAMPVQFPDPVLCMCEGQHADGSSTSYFGSTSGYVFEIDAGTSFDGANIAGGFTLVFNGIGNARMLKRYRKASVELKGSSYATLSFGYDLGYRTQYKDQAADQQTSNDLRSSWWDEMNWDTFNWDGQELSPSELGVTGSAENIAFRVGSDSAQLQPFTVNSITVHYSTRRGIR